MARKNPRKRIMLTDEHVVLATDKALEQNQQLPGLLRDIIAGYADNGTDLWHPPKQEIQVPFSPAFADTIARVDERLKKDGLTLSEVVAHELDKLTAE